MLSQSGRVIGETGLLSIFPAWRTIDWSLIIGDKSARGKGYGTEAAELMPDYAFGYQNMHRVSIDVVGFNVDAIKFYERLGFQREGIQRDGYFLITGTINFVMMSLLEQGFHERRIMERKVVKLRG